MKGKNVSELSEAPQIADFAFGVDVTALMNELNTKLQDKELFVHDMYSLAKAFVRKIEFLSGQLNVDNLTYMTTVKETSSPINRLCRYAKMLLEIVFKTV